ncbi:MAG: winged helix-turn-helix domain-containing protein [Phycisphaerales bacterium]
MQQWIQWYNREGLDALRDAPRPGQQRKLTTEQESRLCAWIDARPDHEAVECARRGPEVHRHVEQTFGVKYSLGGAYAMLHRLGYSALMPRPRHRKADAVSQEQFIKDAPILSRISGVNTRYGSSKSGSRTKRGSGNRAR